MIATRVSWAVAGLIAAAAVAAPEAASAGGAASGPGCPGAGNCYTDNGSPGCDDAACCVIVCELAVLRPRLGSALRRAGGGAVRPAPAMRGSGRRRLLRGGRQRRL